MPLEGRQRRQRCLDGALDWRCNFGERMMGSRVISVELETISDQSVLHGSARTRRGQSTKQLRTLFHTVLELNMYCMKGRT